jgi:hypothetical protein
MEHCAADLGGLTSLLQADIRGRSFKAAARENCDKVDWYPVVGDLAASGDLGFTAGPWACSLASGGAQIQGHYLTIWKRGEGCDWRVQFDIGVSNPIPAEAEPRLSSGGAPLGQISPPPQPAADAAVSQAITDFQSTAGQDGIAAGLRTYARTRDFRFYTDQQAPMGLADANQYFTDHPILGTCEEESRMRSADSTLAYCAGVFTDTKRRSGHAYAQIWQYEPRVASWGLRVLLINSLSPLMSK